MLYPDTEAQIPPPSRQEKSTSILQTKPHPPRHFYSLNDSYPLHMVRLFGRHGHYSHRFAIFTTSPTRRRPCRIIERNMTSINQQPDASKSEPLHIEQLTASSESSDIEGTTSHKDAEKRLLRKLDMRIIPVAHIHASFS